METESAELLMVTLTANGPSASLIVLFVSSHFPPVGSDPPTPTCPAVTSAFPPFHHPLTSPPTCTPVLPLLRRLGSLNESSAFTLSLLQTSFVRKQIPRRGSEILIPKKHHVEFRFPRPTNRPDSLEVHLLSLCTKI